LIPEKDFCTFLSENFNCKKCDAPIKERTIVTVRVGCAFNVYWNCCNKECNSTGNILAKQCTKYTSGQWKKNRPELAACLGDYDINRQIVLACQQSGGGSRMASTFGSLISISRRSIWNRCFTQVEELIGKREIILGEEIMQENLHEEIALSPMNLSLNKAMLTYLVDGGWDQRASQQCVWPRCVRLRKNQKGMQYSLLFQKVSWTDMVYKREVSASKTTDQTDYLNPNRYGLGVRA
jgi:hypothetical protein